MADYGVRLDDALRARSVTYQRLADHVGIKYQAVKKVVDGKTKEFSASNHAKACAFLNISPDWLLDGIGDMNPSRVEGQALSGKARQLGMLLDRIKDHDKRLELFPYCVLVLNQNPKYTPPYPAPTQTPPGTSQKPPERNPDERPE